MKKLLVFMAFCLTAVSHVNGANKISIQDIYIQNGGQAIVTVKYECDNANSVEGGQFTLNLPEGISYVSNTLDSSVKGFSVTTGSSTEGDITKANFGLIPDEGYSLNGTSGTLLYITLKADASLVEGAQKTINVTDIVYSVNAGDGSPNQSVELDATSFKVTVENRIILDENSTKAPSNKTDANVRVNRTINAGKWSTLCLPFTMSEDQVAAAFGDDVQLAQFSGAEFVEDNGDIVEIIMNFNEISEITQHEPCIIKVSSPVSTFTADGVGVKNSASPSYDGENGSFTGTYKAGTVIDEDNLFISGGKFWYSPAEGITTKAVRGYFTLDDVLTNKTATARIGLNVGGEVTYINSLGVEINDDIYYDLQGRRVNNPGKGVYIQNGKKVFVK